MFENNENAVYPHSEGYKTYNEMQTGFLLNGMYRPAGAGFESIRNQIPIRRQPLVAMRMNTMRPIQIPVNMQIPHCVTYMENSQVLQPDQQYQQQQQQQQKSPIPKDPPVLKPYIEIVEQPASRETRFRYQSESQPSGQRTGRIPGKSSTPGKQTFPSIKVHNCSGEVQIVVSCVTVNAPYKVHPHKVTSKGRSENGIVCLTANGGEVVNFTNLGIQCARKKDVVQSINEREAKNVDPFECGYDHKKQPTTIDLSAVRLAFQAFIKTDSKNVTVIPPVVSEPIYDKKSWNELTILHLSHYSAKVSGGMEMILLCDKVSKEDIQIRFFEEDNGEVVWEGKGKFTTTDVYNQSAIHFRTPSYKDLTIEKPVKVSVELRRPSDGATSSPVDFEMQPIRTKCDSCKQCPRCNRFQTNRMENERRGLDIETAVQVPVDQKRPSNEATSSPANFQMQPIAQNYDANYEDSRRKRFRTNEIKNERSGMELPVLLPEELERLLDTADAVHTNGHLNFPKQTMLETQEPRNTKRKRDLQYNQTSLTNFDVPQKNQNEFPENVDNYYYNQHFANAQNYYQAVQQQMETARNFNEEDMEVIYDYLKRHAAMYNKVSMHQGS